jgi:predicted small metal-binding protein
MKESILTLNELLILMAQEMFKELVCAGDGFRVRAKTESEVLKHAKMHVGDAHGVKEITPDIEKDLKSKIKDV